MSSLVFSSNFHFVHVSLILHQDNDSDDARILEMLDELLEGCISDSFKFLAHLLHRDGAKWILLLDPLTPFRLLHMVWRFSKSLAFWQVSVKNNIALPKTAEQRQDNGKRRFVAKKTTTLDSGNNLHADRSNQYCKLHYFRQPPLSNILLAFKTAGIVNRAVRSMVDFCRTSDLNGGDFRRTLIKKFDT